MKGKIHVLGFYSEQAGGSFHHELKLEWGGEKVVVKHPNYGDRLKRTVVRVNGKHT